MTSTTTISHAHTYHGNTEITFSVNNDGALSVTIDTKRLQIRSISEQDTAAYFALFRDQEVMQQYASGQIKTVQKVLDHLERWLQWWQENNPYSGLAVFRKDTHEFIGHGILEYGHMPGQAEVSYLFLKNHWGQGFGTEVVTAIVREYAPAIVKEGYFLEGKPLDLIVATSRFDNPQSGRILEKTGMHAYMQERKHGFWRQRYFIAIPN